MPNTASAWPKDLNSPQSIPRLEPRTRVLPTITSTRGFDAHEILEKRKELMAKSRSAVKRNVIITVYIIIWFILTGFRAEDHSQGMTY